MRYILTERYRLRGWQDMHTAVYDTVLKTAMFFPKQRFIQLMRCDGAHEVDEGNLPEEDRKFFEELKRGKVIRPAGFIEFLLPEQEYKVYPATYKRQAHWSVTGACNLKCRHCFMSAPHARHGVPSHEQIIAIADQLAECGIFQVGLTGGEPLIREDFLEIIDALNEREIGIAVIYTNGWLVDEAFLNELDRRQLKKACLMPMLIVAGNHVREDLAGDQENSWKSRFKARGIQTEIILKGLGELDDIAMKTGGSTNMLTPITVQNVEFNLSGIDTQIKNKINSMSKGKPVSLMEDRLKHEIIREIFDKIAVCISKVLLQASNNTGIKDIIMSGGVSSSRYIRRQVSEEMEKEDIIVYFDESDLATDNGIGIALLGGKFIWD